MTDGFGLAETGKADFSRPLQSCQPGPRLCRETFKIDSRLRRASDLEEQRLLQHQRAVAGDGLGFTLFVGGGRGPPARRVDGHRTTSFSAASRAAMSSPVVVSVTATTRPFCSASTPG